MVSDGAPRLQSGDPPTAGPVPRQAAARVLDIALVGLAALFVSSLAFGGARFFFGTAVLSASSPWSVGAALLIVATLRHGILRRPSTLQCLGTTVKAGRARMRGPVGRAVTPVWVAARLGVLLVGFAALGTIGPPPETRLPTGANPLADMALRWDTGWYLAIAVKGYEWDRREQGQQNIAFFPAVPYLMRAGGAVLGSRARAAEGTAGRLARLQTRTLLAGWILALAASYAALWALYRWACAEAGPRAAAWGVALISAYPFAIYFSAVYTEPFFLLSVLGAFNAVRERRALSAGAWGLFTGLVRPNGFLVSVPLLVLALQQRPVSKRLCAAALLPTAGMLLFSGYLMSLTGRPFAWLEAHAAWGRTPPTWDAAVSRPLEQVAEQGVLLYAIAAPYLVLNGAALLFALGMTPVVWRRLGAAPALLVLVTLVPPLFAGGLMSMGRLTSTLFPIFVALALVIPRRHATAWVVLFAVAQGLAAVLFFTWRPLV